MADAGIALPGVYSMGRSLATFDPPFAGQDATFASTRHDGQLIEDGAFDHCTFAMMGFKEARIKGSSFLDCTFFQCYFRKAELTDSRFIGCRFIDCNFNGTQIRASSFSYSTFSGCQIEFDEMEHSLPAEPNLREALARNLYIESARLGLGSEASRYRVSSIRAREDNLEAAVRARSSYYRQHYPGTRRLSALVHLTASLANRWLWGYGESAKTLVRNAVLLVVIVFPISFLLLANDFVSTSSATVTLVDLVRFSLVTMVPVGIEPGVQPVTALAQALTIFEAVVGLVIVALFASYVFRWSLSR